MSIKILSAIVLSFIIFNFVSCSKDPSSIGSAFLSRDLINLDSLDSYKDTLLSSSGTYKHIIPLSYSTNLLLGSKGNTVATMLLRFNFIIPDSIKADLLTNSLQVTSATVQLYRSYVYGDSTSALNYTVRSVSASTPWATGFTIDSLSGIQSIPVNLISNSESDTLYQFTFDPSIVGTWLNNFAAGGTPDNGIMVVPQNDSKIVGFYALSPVTTVQIPNLRVILSKPGVYSNDTLNFTTTSDVSVVSGIIPVQNQPENIYVQSSIELESRIQFNLSKLPPHAIINYAELQLTIDTTQSLLGTPFTDQLIAEFITDSTHIDSLSSYPVTLNRVGSLYTGNITYYVQNWLSTKINEGIQIKSGSYETGVELWALKGSNAADRSVRPRLKIIYTNKK